MKYSDTELRTLAGRATPLHTRWHGGIKADGGESEAADRLERWRHVLSVDGDDGVLAHRLGLDGLDPRICLPALGSVRLSHDQPVPEWAQRLNTMLVNCRPAKETVYPAIDVADESLPFLDVWVPFVVDATNELRARAGGTLDSLTDDVIGAFQAQLLAALAYMAALPLSLEFRRFLSKHDPLSMFNRAGADTSSHPREYYDRFVDHLRGSELLAFFEEYPTLARMLAEVCGHWTEHVAEFCIRLNEDRAALVESFNRGLDPGRVVRVRIGVSDPHHGRRDVVISRFESGLQLVYKPKDLNVDEAFWQFIDWVNRQALYGGDLRLRTLTVLNRTTHGWVEFVEHQPCRDPQSIERYYRRVGMLLCVAYVLGATDFHQENIIASGEQPVLVDLETMLQPMPRSFDGLRTSSADQRALEIMHDSVLRVGLLPFWIAGDRGRSYDVSGIGAEGPLDTGYLGIQWEYVNTDRMQPVHRSVSIEQEAKRPMLNGELVSARDYAAEIIDGFTLVYGVMLAHRGVLLAEDGLLSRFRGVRLRCVLRMTKAYAQLLNRRMHPEYLRDGADGGIEMERLARDFIVLQPDPDCPSPWGVYRAEAKALERLDIPLFTFFSDSETLFADGHPVAPGFFSETGLQCVSATLRKLSEEDLRVQTDFIRASLHARYAGGTTDDAQRATSDAVAAYSGRPSLTREEFIAAASSIAERIRRSAIPGADGGVTWLSMAFDPTVERMNFLPMTDNLYDGRIGVAFFLAALEHVAGGAGYRDLAIAAVLPLRKALRQRVPPLALPTMLGGAIGLGGQVYALVRIASWLADDELLRLATRAAGWFVSKRIVRDEYLDVCAGAAGGILGLLALPTDCGFEALNLAVQCGDHLLEKRVLADTGHLAWRGRWVSQPLTGFGHGAAGITYALLRLSQASGEDRFRQAAAEAIAYETAVYSADVGNWPDFRANRESVSPMVAWCNGAAGIGLGRLGGLPALDTSGIRSDIINALETTRATPPSDEDHVCCGNLGRLELLIEASRRLGRPELFDEARRHASAVVRRAERNGRFGLLAQVPGVTDSFSLFQGTAGIGYQLLRLADPDRLPCMLLWE
ncbi:MAG: type 2 lanthipeptide synthetase LanM family protein [Pseudomonadota bacterium]|nr:type 2 lanthipeptide synthetase LanM family protein [Pseudomonadota bacterium]